jgi:hypothetical protein
MFLLGPATPYVVDGIPCLELQNFIFLAMVLETQAPESSWRLVAVGSAVTKTLAAVILRHKTLGPVGVDFYNDVGRKIFSDFYLGARFNTKRGQ